MELNKINSLVELFSKNMKKKFRTKSTTFEMVKNEKKNVLTWKQAK